MNKIKCPKCGGIDLDHWPETSKFAYCYTCKQSVQVISPVTAEQSNHGEKEQ
jgi:hypothetical protein